MSPGPPFLVVGHLTLDAENGSYLVGGTAYAALTWARMGCNVGLVTSYGPDLDPYPLLEGIIIRNLPAPASTIFRNVYSAGARRDQFIVSQALRLQSSQIPNSWSASNVLLNPMAGEIGPEFLDAFPDSFMGACPQGWMRSWGPDGRVKPAVWSWASDALPRLDAVILSEDDLAGDWALAADWAALVRGCLVVTCGADGAWVYSAGQREHVPAFQAGHVVDPTGAGDAFAAAFILKYGELSDSIEAARFGSLVASFVVQARGTDGVPGREAVTRGWRQVAGG